MSESKMTKLPSNPEPPSDPTLYRNPGEKKTLKQTVRAYAWTWLFAIPFMVSLFVFEGSMELKGTLFTLGLGASGLCWFFGNGHLMFWVITIGIWMCGILAKVLVG